MMKSYHTNVCAVMSRSAHNSNYLRRSRVSGGKDSDPGAAYPAAPLPFTDGLREHARQRVLRIPRCGLRQRTELLLVIDKDAHGHRGPQTSCPAGNQRAPYLRSDREMALLR